MPADNSPFVLVTLALVGIFAFTTRVRRPGQPQDNAALWIFGLLALATGLALSGCGLSHSVARVPVVDPQGVVVTTAELKSTDASFLRKRAYDSKVEAEIPWGDLKVSIEHTGCDQGMSGNLSYLALAAAAAVAPPVTVAAAAAGVAGSEAAKPDVSHQPERCEAWGGPPLALPPIPGVPEPNSPGTP